MSKIVAQAAALVLLTLASVSSARLLSPADRQAIQEATERDDRQMLGQLGITPNQLRPDPSGENKAPNAVIHDEAKTTSYTTLRGPLVFNNGTKVFTPPRWQGKRRPEIVAIDGDIAFRMHDVGHTNGPNWPSFLKFALRYLTAPAPRQATGPSKG